MPDDDGCCYADVDGVFGAELWYFETVVAGIDDLLLYAFDFIAEYDGVFGMWIWNEMLKVG